MEESLKLVKAKDGGADVTVTRKTARFLTFYQTSVVPGLGREKGWRCSPCMWPAWLVSGTAESES